MKVRLFGVLALVTVACAGCTVHQTAAPGLSGPSDLGISIRVTASPDSINQDGGSQSSIQVTAIGPDGKGKAALPLRMDMLVGGVGQDYGTLSARSIVTNANGVATVMYTAPPSPTAGIFGTCKGLPGNCVQIVATASGSGFESAQPEAVTIRLVPPGVILPPASTPTAQFTFSPSSPAANSPVAFDGSSSCAGAAITGGCAATNNTLTGFSWNFGDGQTGTGQSVSHAFASPGTYNVTLTVTNDRGITSTPAVRPVTVGAGVAPTAAFVFSPTPVVANVETFFDASASRAAPGHTIASYAWNFGDGDPIATRTSPTENHDFGAAGTYTVVLTVTDEVGQQATTSQTVTVTSGAPTAVIVVTKTGGMNVVGDGSGSTASTGSTIVSYTWFWSDGSASTSGTVVTHTFPALVAPATSATYTVRLTVTDNLGRTGTATQSITVP